MHGFHQPSKIRFLIFRSITLKGNSEPSINRTRFGLSSLFLSLCDPSASAFAVVCRGHTHHIPTRTEAEGRQELQQGNSVQKGHKKWD